VNNVVDKRGFFASDKEVTTTRTEGGTLGGTDAVWCEKDRLDIIGFTLW